MASWTKARTARKRYRCDTRTWGCTGIKPGDRCLVSACTPHHDGMGNTTWRHYKECATCATTYGRGKLLNA